MPVRVLKIQDQNNIRINNGEIEENKPVGLSTNRRSIRPYSTIFYFSNQWTDIGSKITEHSHKGFEIVTINIRGTIEHYYPDLKKRITISSGDVEYISCGYGIKHEEFHKKNCQSLQIWFDPNLRKSLAEPPKVEHFDTNVFPSRNISGITKSYIVGEESPLELKSQDIQIIDFKISPGLRNFHVKEDQFYSCYVVRGEVEIDGKTYGEDTFFVVKDEEDFNYYANAHTRMFVVVSPANPGYKTYIQLKSGN